MPTNCDILPSPPQPGLFRICPQCQRWFAIELESIRLDKSLERVEVFRCKHCHSVVEFAKRPPSCV